MGMRTVVHLARWAIILMATVVAVGATALLGSGAQGLTGDAGPIKVSVLPAVGLTDGQVVHVHAESTDSAVVIYSVTAHLCVPDKVTGDRSFSFAGVACTNVVVGQSDVEQTNVTGGSPSADLDFKVGTGTASWLSSTGYNGAITCGQGSPCDLVLKIEVTDSTLYYRAPLCFGKGCAKDPDAPPPVVPTVPDTVAPAAAATDDAGSTGGGKAVPAGSSSAAGKKTVPGGSSRSDAPDSPGGSAAGPRLQSRVSADETSPTVWRLRLVAAALVGAIGGARIVSLVAGIRRRASIGAAS